jgi:hypothetical protein
MRARDVYLEMEDAAWQGAPLGAVAAGLGLTLAEMWVFPASRCAPMELYSWSNPSSVEESRGGSPLTTLERKAPSSP